ncbi:MAG: hydrogenase nickel incorporation protein HypB [Oscillatoriales cyanobacterium RM2_1_1]|nr:hydrogenase nickel incorporation protein HypB [Oscillatoriales cyanobacterium SM2_3_0]NJO44437.1 hydrogenase nickel incorporation protein HypB [Oscillatoriales cyanobacterium RM2_1_1]
MCVTCGCANENQVILINPQTGETIELETSTDQTHSHSHSLPDGRLLTHTHGALNSDSAVDNSPTIPPEIHAKIHAEVHGRTITLEQEILAKNNSAAAQNRRWFREQNILALNLVSSPGAGKTTLLTRTINDLKSQISFSVIEGDQATDHDAEKIRATGCNTVQINTGTGCHLEATMIAWGYRQLNPPSNSIVMIENVGNLVCPALFDLGEQGKVAILSVTEGEDKPIKYPHLFRASQVMILTKIDLLPYLNFDLDQCLEYAYGVNPQMKIFQVSALTGAGLNDWYDWLNHQLING